MKSRIPCAVWPNNWISWLRPSQKPRQKTGRPFSGPSRASRSRFRSYRKIDTGANTVEERIQSHMTKWYPFKMTQLLITWVNVTGPQGAQSVGQTPFWWLWVCLWGFGWMRWARKRCSEESREPSLLAGASSHPLKTWRAWKGWPFFWTVNHLLAWQPSSWNPGCVCARTCVCVRVHVC